MKKIILLMLLAFTSTTFVHADDLDNKITAYKCIITQIKDNILNEEPNEELHLFLQQQANTFIIEIENIVQRVTESNKLKDLKKWSLAVKQGISQKITSMSMDLSMKTIHIMNDPNANMQTIDALRIKTQETSNKIRKLGKWNSQIYPISSSEF
ncbi:MAG: hypothetical protein Q8S31_01160 [Alphaproteobacteria bacterium]|nr:hypothetical protein [Alphaproteobacteria bacterium]